MHLIHGHFQRHTDAAGNAGKALLRSRVVEAVRMPGIQRECAVDFAADDQGQGSGGFRAVAPGGIVPGLKTGVGALEHLHLPGADRRPRGAPTLGGVVPAHAGPFQLGAVTGFRPRRGGNADQAVCLLPAYPGETVIEHARRFLAHELQQFRQALAAQCMLIDRVEQGVDGLQLHPLGDFLHRAHGTQRAAFGIVEGFAQFHDVLDPPVREQQAVLGAVWHVACDRFAVGVMHPRAVFRVDGVQEGVVGSAEG